MVKAVNTAPQGDRIWHHSSTEELHPQREGGPSTSTRICMRRLLWNVQTPIACSFKLETDQCPPSHISQFYQTNSTAFCKNLTTQRPPYLEKQGILQLNSMNNQPDSKGWSFGDWSNNLWDETKNPKETEWNQYRFRCWTLNTEEDRRKPKP